jgi:hypothetical protein
MKTLPITIHEIWPIFMFLQTDRRQTKNYMPLIFRYGGIEIELIHL